MLARQVLSDRELALWNAQPEAERVTWLRVRLVAKEAALDAFAESPNRRYRGRDVEARDIDGGFAIVAPDDAIVEIALSDTTTTTDAWLRDERATVASLQVPVHQHREPT